ncbi:MAG: tRNA preQ1(34) S-adenosylmethionine ribosyltransferase-isomerase QueA [Patescibacteria group bacterium]|nr:tRNA preQ1(34) S-adenosylmethionine ribosyltransferase-isomerase QueA [Patescibacteria group bacterium]
MFTSDFNYNLPQELIAQSPARPRDSSRLMVLDRKTGAIEHQHFYDLPEFLKSGDVLVFNETKVFKARLMGKLGGREIEIFLLRERDGLWQALARPAKLLETGAEINFPGGLVATVADKDSQGIVAIKFNLSEDELMAAISEIGKVPTPPYIKTLAELEDYQTVYAKNTGSVAAPTAGFHFTSELLEKLKTAGVSLEFLTLHVGLGTFRPVQSENLEDHEMHAEFVELDAETADRISRAKQEGRRIIAIGTTTTRALEGIAATNHGALKEFRGDINIFIKPGFEFKIIDGLITNFHLPKSTLLVLVSALAGREKILAAYQEAVNQKYRFYSFGDAMLIT